MHDHHDDPHGATGPEPDDTTEPKPDPGDTAEPAPQPDNTAESAPEPVDTAEPESEPEAAATSKPAPASQLACTPEATPQFEALPQPQPTPEVQTASAPGEELRLVHRDPDEVAEELLRRRFAVGRKAAMRSGATVAAVAVVAALVGIGLQAYATQPPPADRPTGTVTVPAEPVTPTADPAPSPPPPGITAPGLTTLDAAGLLHRPEGPPVRIPLAANTRPVDAVRVAAGWVVRTTADDPLAMHVAAFLGDDGRLRDFAPRLTGAQTAFRADGRAMAAYLHPYLYLYDLPSGRERTRLDVRTAARGNQVHDMWLTGDRLLVSWGVLEGAHAGAITGLVAYDLRTGTATVTEDVLVADVSGDGATALVPDGAGCVRVAGLGRTLRLPRAAACLPGWTVLGASLSPDGSLVALTLGPVDLPSGEGRLRLFRTADLAVGRVRELGGHDGPLQPAGWLGPAELAAVAGGRESFDEVFVCVAAGCHPVPLGGQRVAVVPTRLP
ncbi:hypothetical protein [Catellatospora sp. NPDC049609]|uniref:hypothetical protein n=1 Tax=Catellatospora sp. NPDC049609 TaxID=3155505 RepID=UPI00342E1335